MGTFGGKVKERQFLHSAYVGKWAKIEATVGVYTAAALSKRTLLETAFCFCAVFIWNAPSGAPSSPALLCRTDVTGVDDIAVRFAVHTTHELQLML